MYVMMALIDSKAQHDRCMFGALPFRLCACVLEGQEEFKEKVQERIQKKNRLILVKKCDCWIDERAFWATHAGV